VTKVVLSVIDVAVAGERSRVEAEGPTQERTRLLRRSAFQLLAPERYLGGLRVVVADGAEVLVDGNLVGATPLLSAVLLAPARHEVEVRVAGLAPYRRFIDVEFEQDVTLTLEVTKTAIIERQLQTGASQEIKGGDAGPGWLLIVGGTTAGAGMLALGGGAIAAGLAAQSKARFEQPSGTPADAAANRQQTMFATGLWIGGGAALVAGAAMVVAHLVVEQPEDAPAESDRR
jgi:hypothetical protein